MKNLILIFFVVTISMNVKSQEVEVFAGTVERYPMMSSEYLDSRNVDVWLPEDYDPSRQNGYPVIYMHDGQNLFDEKFGYGGMTWGVDEVLTVLQRINKVEPTIVVGIWNTSKRWREYMPQKPFETLSNELKEKIMSEKKGGPVSDAYLKFLVKELKPFVDKKYNTLPDKENTFIMGSSMGGLISWYAACEYPEVFGAAGCVSTHWPGAVPEGPDEIPQAFFNYLDKNMKPGNQQRIYFDFGTETLDAFYEPLQKRADKVMRANGFDYGNNWTTRKFSGHKHDEASWNKRLHEPLLFLMGKE